MTRFALRISQNFLDVTILVIAFVAAFFLRFDGVPPYPMLKRMFFLVPYVAALQFSVLYFFGVPRYAWRYIGLREVTRIVSAIGVAAALLLVARLISTALVVQHAWARYALVPGAVTLIDAALAFLGIAGIRSLWRIRNERLARRRHVQQMGGLAPARTLLIGAGRAGIQVAREIVGRPDLGIVAIGFIDDDEAKRGRVLHGVAVLGTTRQMAALVKRHRVQQVIITIASATGADIRRIVGACDAAGVPAKIIPSIHEILDEKVALNRIRPVSIEDLLGRDAVSLEPELAAALIGARCVVVTGAGGSIGSELCRQVARLGPERLILVERAEPALFGVFDELRRTYPNLDLVPTICDVCDAERVASVLARHRPHVIFHAAAHKHVPMMEYNPGEAIKNNVFGTRTMAEAADRAGVGTFVLISTDKAVNPTSVMGATKRVAEITIQALGQHSKTRYVAVRFGNVLGSAGSVIPIFQAQIRAGGPVTVTHPEMRRYFMTIPEASQLVMQAGAMGHGGEIFILDMGEPVKIVDLARDLIRLSGFEPDVEMPIVFTKIRPGEKLFEEIGFDAKEMDKTRHPKIYVGKLAPVALERVTHSLEVLARATGATTREEAVRALELLVPEMQHDARTTRAPDALPTRRGAPAVREPCPAAIRPPTRPILVAPE